VVLTHSSDETGSVYKILLPVVGQLTNSMEQSPWEANTTLARKIPHLLWTMRAHYRIYESLLPVRQLCIWMSHIIQETSQKWEIQVTVKMFYFTKKNC